MSSDVAPTGQLAENESDAVASSTESLVEMDDDSQELSELLSASESEGSTELGRDEIFEVLSNRRRRYVLRYLEEHADESVDFRELVDQVAAWENETTIQQLSSSDRKCVYTALRQTHLPKLDRLDVVEYDSQRGVVTSTEYAADVMLYMEYVPEDDISWSQFYVLLSGLCGALAILVWIGVFPFGGVPGLVVAVLVAGLFGVAALVQSSQSWWARAGSSAENAG